MFGWIETWKKWRKKLEQPKQENFILLKCEQILNIIKIPAKNTLLRHDRNKKYKPLSA